MSGIVDSLDSLHLTLTVAGLLVGYVVTVTLTLARWKATLDGAVKAIGSLEKSLEKTTQALADLHDDIQADRRDAAVLAQRVLTLEQSN